MAGADADTGLLSPGRAGSPAEAATGDTAFLQAMLDAEAALTRAQAAAGLAPGAAAEAVTAAADAGRFDARDLALRARSGGNPVIPLVADLTAGVPAEYGEYVHRGATSQDIMDTAMMLMAARTLGLIEADLDRAAEALAGLAARHRTTPMPGRTLTQHAVPTTFGLKAAGWRSLVLDARDRVRAVRAALPCQLGGAAGTLAAFTAFAAAGPAAAGQGEGRGATDPAGVRSGADANDAADASAADALLDAYARQTGLARPVLPWHTLRTPVADLAAALAFAAAALGKPAVDVATLSRTEIGELAEGSRGGSSAMPHKANPVRATLLIAAAQRAPLLAAALCAALTAPDERPSGSWHAEWEPLRDLLRLTGGAARDAVELTEGLRVHPDRMRAHLDLTHGLIVSERLSAELAPRLGRARAKQLLTEAAGRAEGEGRMLTDVLAGLPEIASLGLDLAELTDPARYTGHAADLTDRALERS
ncbi:lyase family protein [Streptomyces sp. TS71-3]|uniref:lyase family protein n=1 Tax=Streptomyces sp. TS71-3 TaxID=2733862 RepID=UPI001B216B2A|nr:lyase family protein [Streptomyces sp. TS71-3]GHJ41812.1 3-carboxy-cis,cis-muconate cycloisomerase [Streptomyces sp. TS71-3]